MSKIFGSWLWDVGNMYLLIPHHKDDRSPLFENKNHTLISLFAGYARQMDSLLDNRKDNKRVLYFYKKNKIHRLLDVASTVLYKYHRIIGSVCLLCNKRNSRSDHDVIFPSQKESHSAHTVEEFGDKESTISWHWKIVRTDPPKHPSTPNNVWQYAYKNDRILHWLAKAYRSRNMLGMHAYIHCMHVSHRSISHTDRVSFVNNTNNLE